MSVMICRCLLEKDFGVLPLEFWNARVERLLEGCIDLVDMAVPHRLIAETLFELGRELVDLFTCMRFSAHHSPSFTNRPHSARHARNVPQVVNGEPAERRAASGTGAFEHPTPIPLVWL